MKKKLGEIFLFSKDVDFSKIEDGYGSRYSDGSGYFDGNDGTKIQMYSDGSGYYEGADGSTGQIYSDGSGFYEGTDGSRGNRNADGSGYFEDEYGTTEYYNSNHAHDTSTNSEDFGLIEGLGSLLLVFTLGKLSKKISKKEDCEEDNENYDEEKEEVKGEDEQEEEEKHDEQQKEVKTQKTRKKYRTKKKKNNDIKILLICFGFIFLSIIVSFIMEYIYSTPKEGKIKISINVKDYIGVNYEQVKEKFEDMGFTNIKCVPNEDLITGWINENESTDRITIDNDSDLKKDEIFPEDAEVVITYHSFKIKD